jgi:hypothetical protein
MLCHGVAIAAADANVLPMLLLLLLLRGQRCLAGAWGPVATAAAANGAAAACCWLLRTAGLPLLLLLLLRLLLLAWRAVSAVRLYKLRFGCSVAAGSRAADGVGPRPALRPLLRRHRMPRARLLLQPTALLVVLLLLVVMQVRPLLLLLRRQLLSLSCTATAHAAVGRDARRIVTTRRARDCCVQAGKGSRESDGECLGAAWLLVAGQAGRQGLRQPRPQHHACLLLLLGWLVERARVNVRTSQPP